MYKVGVIMFNTLYKVNQSPSQRGPVESCCNYQCASLSTPCQISVPHTTNLKHMEPDTSPQHPHTPTHTHTHPLHRHTGSYILQVVVCCCCFFFNLVLISICSYGPHLFIYTKMTTINQGVTLSQILL